MSEKAALSSCLGFLALRTALGAHSCDAAVGTGGLTPLAWALALLPGGP